MREARVPNFPPPPDDEPSEDHDHRWQAVGIYDYQIGTDAMMGQIRHGVAQSCECGEVRGVPLFSVGGES